MIEFNHPSLSLRAQCLLLNIHRGGIYYEPVKETSLNLKLMRHIDELHTKYPFYGSRQLCENLKKEGFKVNRKRIQRLMHVMGIEAFYCKPKTTISEPSHKIYPYLLRGVPITKVRQVWSIDITYIRMRDGFLFLTAVLDWFSRFVLSWRLSNAITVDFCKEALFDAFKFGVPDIFNSDQGSQFTSNEFTKELISREIQISMDGRGRAIDNVFIERLWRTVKYEEVYLKDYSSGRNAHAELKTYFNFYNSKRLHSSLDYRTPRDVFMHS